MLRTCAVISLTWGLLILPGCNQSPEQAPQPGAGEAAQQPAAYAPSGATQDTDTAITVELKRQFRADPALAGVNVGIKGGVVTLDGAVVDRAEADHAVALAQQTNGVTRVVNNIRVG